MYCRNNQTDKTITTNKDYITTNGVVLGRVFVFRRIVFSVLFVNYDLLRLELLLT